MNKRQPNKRCSSCKEAKYLKDFSKNKNRPDGHHAQCKECRSKYKPSEESLKKNRERLRKWNRFKATGFTQEDFDKKLIEHLVQKGYQLYVKLSDIHKDQIIKRYIDSNENFKDNFFKQTTILV